MFDIDVVASHLRRHTRALVCIDGPAGAGKTTLADQLRELRPDAVIIHMDELYDGWVNALDAGLTSRLIRDIRDPFLAGEVITYRRYDWHTAAFTEHVTVTVPDLLILEGVASAQEVTRSVAALSVFIDVEPTVGRQRVLERDGASSADHIDAWQQQEQAHFLRDRTPDSVTIRLRS